MTKKIFLILLALVSVFCILGCGSPTGSTPSPASPTLDSTPPTNIMGPDGTMYVGNTDTNIFHYIDCVLAEEIPETARVWFPEGQKPIHGYEPCTRCNP